MTKRCIGWSALITAAMSLTGLAQQPESTHPLTVCLTVSDGLKVDPSVKAAVLTEVNRVWRPLRVAVIEPVESSGTCDRSILVKSDREARPEDGGGETAIAWVPFVAGRARRVVFVRTDRARMLIDAFSPGHSGIRPPGLTDQLLVKLLGRSLAHELGHVLLNSMDHERSGLMRARYGASDVLRDLPSAYGLDAKQRERLFARTTSAAEVASR